MDDNNPKKRNPDPWNIRHKTPRGRNARLVAIGDLLSEAIIRAANGELQYDDANLADHLNWIKSLLGDLVVEQEAMNWRDSNPDREWRGMASKWEAEPEPYRQHLFDASSRLAQATELLQSTLNDKKPPTIPKDSERQEGRRGRR